ncbi:MAG TPA: lipase, partial [Bacillota bacterium]|nr:lipase [Bacillota bacterium]
MDDLKWVAGWGASISYVAQNYADYFKDQTFRYVIFPTINAKALRLHFSNQYGTESVTVDKVYLAQRTTGEFVDPATNAAVTFGGKGSVTLPAGGGVISDEIPFTVEAGREFCVSMYISGLTQIATGHSNSGPYITKY